jgi:hypothetical protein
MFFVVFFLKGVYWQMRLLIIFSFFVSFEVLFPQDLSILFRNNTSDDFVVSTDTLFKTSIVSKDCAGYNVVHEDFVITSGTESHLYLSLNLSDHTDFSDYIFIKNSKDAAASFAIYLGMFGTVYTSVMPILEKRTEERYLMNVSSDEFQYEQSILLEQVKVMQFFSAEKNAFVVDIFNKPMYAHRNCFSKFFHIFLNLFL